ncbi:Glycerol kinase [Dissostichus eleginoides]|uniref:Glycerol kinase n=1 Tax=Dissostichus eleginoides TaxID=100907 RepID=A0AAD9CKY6_DISEL|nr:Glycerol kinase [Dissostichus eleginoides]
MFQKRRDSETESKTIQLRELESDMIQMKKTAKQPCRINYSNEIEHFNDTVELIIGIPFIMEKPKEYTDFQKLTRAIFKLLRTYHNWGPIKQAIAGSAPVPKSLTQTRDWLAGSFRPCLPKDNTSDLLAGNATNWLHTGLQILDEHYEGTIADLHRGLTQLSKEDCERAWTVATKWIKSKYPHVQDQVFSLARLDLEQLG